MAQELSERPASTTPSNTSLFGLQEQISGVWEWRKIAWPALAAALYNVLTFVKQGGTVNPGTIWNGAAIPIANGGTAATTTAAARSSLGVAIGSNVQAWSAALDGVTAATGLTLTNSGLGYTGGAGLGGTVTQSSSRSTGVTCNALTGAITMMSTSLAAGADASFVVSNNQVTINDVVLISLRNTTSGLPLIWVSNVAAGSFTIKMRNLHASTPDTTADVINFAVIKGAVS